MKSTQFTAVLFLFALLLCFPVYAQRQGGRPGGGDRQGGQQQRQRPTAAMVMEKLDLNNDGVIDLDEAAKDDRGIILENFKEIDANEDQVIDLDELKASLSNKRRRGPNAKKLMKELDDNEDGKLNELEVAAKDNRLIKNNFNDIDTNDDNEISLKE